MKKLIIPALAICLSLAGCSSTGASQDIPKKDILLTVNGEALYQEEFDKISAKYKEKGLTEAEILEGMVLELVTLEKADDFSVSVSEELYQEEFDKISAKYKEKGLTEAEILEGMVLELVTLEKADDFSVSVSEEDVQARYEELLALDQSLFQEKALEQYGSEDAFLEALHYKLIYEGTADQIKNSFSQSFSLNDAVLQERTKDYVSQYAKADFEENDMDAADFEQETMHTYTDSLLSSLQELYFKVWQYQTAANSELSYVSYDGEPLFQKSDYAYQTAANSELSYVSYDGEPLFQKSDYALSPDSLTLKGKTYDLKELSLAEVQDRFGNYFYLSNTLTDSYGALNASAVHIPEQDVRALYATLGDDKPVTIQMIVSPASAVHIPEQDVRALYATLGDDKPVTIQMIVSPILSLYHDFKGNGFVTSTENGLTTLTYLEPALGIYYEVSAARNETELEAFFRQCLPYLSAQSSDPVSPEEFQAKVELTDGVLYFNDYTTAESDIAYFSESARTEQWNTTQVTDYLGVSFTPSYVPAGLTLCETPYSDTFLSETVNDTMYWTVAYENDSLVFDNFGLFYSDSFSEEYNPLRKTLVIEVSKHKLPQSDVLYHYENDSLVFDNFGLFYSDSFSEEYNPLRKTLVIEVSKHKLPQSDVLYHYDTTEASTLQSIPLTIGAYQYPYYEGGDQPAGYVPCYVAEFMDQDVGYRVKSENLTQQEFIDVLHSLPVFQES